MRGNNKNSNNSKPLIAIIAAMSENNIIALNNRIPWRIPEDLKRFKKLTMDNEIIIGRKTYDKLKQNKNSKSKILPRRKLKIISNQKAYNTSENKEIYNSIEEAIQSSKQELIWIAGGGEIYKETIHYADVLEITKVNKLFSATNLKKTFFPNINYNEWTPIRSQNEEEYTFITYVRNSDENSSLKKRIETYEQIILKENKQLLKNKIYTY